MGKDFDSSAGHDDNIGRLGGGTSRMEESIIIVRDEHSSDEDTEHLGVCQQNINSQSKYRHAHRR